MYVDPNRNTEAGNLKWILPYCNPTCHEWPAR